MITNKPNLENLSVSLVNDVFSDKQPVYKRLILALIILIFCWLSIYQIGERIAYYESEPTTVTSRMHVQKRIRFPSITICPTDGFNGPLIENAKIRYNVTSVYELLKTELDLNDIWRLTGNNVTGRMNRCLYGSMALYCKKKDIQHLFTIGGLCHTIKFKDPLIYNGRSDLFSMAFLHDNQSNSKYKAFIHDYDLNIVYGGMVKEFHIKPLTTTLFYFQHRMTKFVNVSRKPCYDTDVYEECIIRCYENEDFKNKSCRLPYMTPERFNKTLCATPQEFQAAYPVPHESVETALITKIRPCKKQCGRPCFKQEYDVQLGNMNYVPNDKRNTIAVAAIPLHKDIKLFTERISYSIDSLLCDIGSILGIWLGFSLLTAFEFVEAIWFIVVYHVKQRLL
ncbi:hypothetical protein CHUAL_002397 [Chamberlinius hualienensis]